MRVFPGWWQVGVALLLQASGSASVFTAYSVIAASLEQTFAPSRLMLMMGVTLVSLGAGTLGPFLGAAIDRFSVRRLMLAGTLLLGGGFVLLSFATSMYQVLAVYFIPLSLGSLLTGPLAGSALLARWFSRRRGLAMSIAASGAAIGGLVLPPLLQWLIDTVEWRLALRLFGGGLFLLTAPWVALLVINRPSERGLYPDGEVQPTAAAGRGAAGKAGSLLYLLRDRNFWLIAVILGVALGGPVGLLSNLVPLVMEKGIGAAQGALLLSVFSAANFTGKLSCGVIADRVDYRLILVAIVLVQGLGFFGYLQFTGYLILALFIFVLGVAQGASVPLWSIILARVYGADNMGRSMGLMSTFIMPFTLAAPPLFGWVHDLSGSYAFALAGCIALLLCTLGLIAMIRAGAAEAAMT